MGKVIRMDLYRLTKSFSFRFGIILIFIFNLASGPIEKLGYELTIKIAESAENKEEMLKEAGEWINEFHLGNIIADQLGIICTAIFLIVVVKFCYADIQHGYIKNIAGQLPSRGHTIISKFVVIEIAIPLFFIVTIIGSVVGNLIIGRTMVTDMFYAGSDGAPDKVFELGYAFGELAVKMILLSVLGALVLLLTTGLGSNIAGTIAAVLCGAGFTSLAYTGISAGINKLFNLDDDKKIYLSDYMPDSLYRTNLVADDMMKRAVVIGIVTAGVLVFLTLKMFNKKDIS